MAYEPVARRTRLRRAQEFERIKQINKKKCRDSRRELKKKQEEAEGIYVEIHGGGEEEEEEEEIMELDENEYEKMLRLKRNLREDDLVSERFGNVGTSDDGDFHGHGHGHDHGDVDVDIHSNGDDGGKVEGQSFEAIFEEREKDLMDDGLDGDCSDDNSCQILGEKFNPCDIAGIGDDDDDDDDDDGDETDDDDHQDDDNAKQASESESSSEEDDIEEDTEFKIDKPDQSTSYSSTDTGSSDDSIEDIQEETCVNDGAEVKNKEGERRKRRTKNGELRVFDGLTIPSNPIQSTTQSASVVDRTRSHWKPKVSSITKQGVFSSPVEIEEISFTDSEFYDRLDDNEDEEIRGLSRTNDPNPGRAPASDDGAETRTRERPPKKKKEKLPRTKKKKKSAGFKDDELQRILLNTTTENGDENLEDLISFVGDLGLPLKFKFGVEVVSPPEKSEEERELDDLWKELEFSLAACNIGVNNCSLAKGDDLIHSDTSISQEKLCEEGKHYLILDEEIGIVCKFCSYVTLEIKHCISEFDKNPFGENEFRGYARLLYDDEKTRNQSWFESNHETQASNNLWHDTYDTVWDLIPGTKRCLYPHQQEGFEFMWKNVAGGIKISELEKPINSGLGGCIICHAPGTGKTRLATVFLQSYMKMYPQSKPVIVAPSSVLYTWEEEFGRWRTNVHFLNMNRSDLNGEKDYFLRSLLRKNVNDSTGVRYAKLLAWSSGRGVLGISYSLFEKLTRKGKSEEKSEEKSVDNELMREILLQKPGIMVLDEGHTPRNENSRIWKSLSDAHTKKKIILSGTPFQNNFQELYNTIALVREEFVDPFLVDSCRDYSRKRGRKHHDSRAFLGLNEGRRIEELRARIKPFVHVYKGDILKQTLPGLFNCVLLLNSSSPVQTRCSRLVERRTSNFERNHLVSVTSVHPSILLNGKKVPNFLDDELKDELKKENLNLHAGVKAWFLFELLKLNEREKVLVFGQYIPPLKFIIKRLKEQFHWTEGEEILYMFGEHRSKIRTDVIKVFNDPTSNARVLLASTKACSEGIHLVGASRVVLLDVVWNPSVERQAISRAYRLGQQKNVHVYHLILANSHECEKYWRMVLKDRVSQMVFTASECENLQNVTSGTSSVSDDWILDELIRNEKTKVMFDKIIYQPKADDLNENFG